MQKSGRGPFILIFVLLILPVGVAVWLLQQRWLQRNAQIKSNGNLSRVSPPADFPGSLSPDSSPDATPQPPATQEATPTPLAPQDEVSGQPLSQTLPGYVGKLELIVPVLGVSRAQLQDTFGDARSEGRVHDAIDISAPLGTPVVATAAGEIIKLFESERGGTTIYQLSVDKKLVYYYAHLQRYSDDLVPGKFVRQGDVIAYVGETGNAGAGNYHLHFSILIVSDPQRYWEGTSINPYPLLRR
jgi:murein DD-endopeptidase MepM/ murein hydrolase activator NlpD